VERALLAKVGAFLFLGALIAPAWASAVSAQGSSVMATAMDAAVETRVSTAPGDPTIELPELHPRLPYTATANAIAEGPRPPSPPEPLVTDGVVLASWYGPGFYGNRTACGQTYGAEVVGVAHRSLACGTRIEITSPGGVTVLATVIDRGPYVAGRSLDLSFALKTALRCSDLCSVRMVVVEK
jgi:rare lipoprotein A (peptidoglycan hydrolase)